MVKPLLLKSRSYFRFLHQVFLRKDDINRTVCITSRNDIIFLEPQVPYLQ